MMWNREVALLGLRQMVRTRKFLFAALVSLVPLLAGAILIAVDATQQVTSTWDPDMAGWIAYMALGGTVPFVALLLSGGLLADDAEDRTLSYLLVRPIPRRVLYLSKAAPVLLATAGFAVLQVLLFGLMRLVSYGLFGDGLPVAIEGGTMGGVPYILQATGAGMLAAALAGVAYAALFGFVSLVTTRYHFIVNLLIYLVWELPFGSLGGRGFGLFTVLFHTRSVLDGLDPAPYPIVPDAAPAFGAMAWLVAWAVLWLAAAALLMGRRDFNVTSAAS